MILPTDKTLSFYNSPTYLIDCRWDNLRVQFIMFTFNAATGIIDIREIRLGSTMVILPVYLGHVETSLEWGDLSEL